MAAAMPLLDPFVEQPVDIRRPITLKTPPPPQPGELQLTEDFLPLLNRPARYKVYYGGRCAAKSESMARALVWLAARTKIRVLCTREIQKTIAESVHKNLCACIESMGYSRYFTITQAAIRSSAGAEFIFMGLRSDPAEIKSLHAINIVWVEEGQAVSKLSWDILTKTVRKVKESDPEPQIWVSFNPFEEDDHTYKLFVIGKRSIEEHFPGSYVKYVNWDRNPWFEASGLNAERLADIARIDEAVDEAGRTEAYLRVMHIWEGRVHRLPGGNFFSLSSMLVNGLPAELPNHPTYVFATMDTAMKTGMERDGVGVVYWALDIHNVCEYPLYILGWDYRQIDGALLETWLPSVLEILEDFAKQTAALQGARGVHIEDQGSGSVLIQQGINHGWPTHAIKSKLTGMGKAERCLDVSSYVHLGQVKMTQAAFDQRVTYKGETKNHLLDQVLSFNASVKEKTNVADDLRDAWCYGIAIGLGNYEGF
jgi:PBSX family phage terminase large subunit